jgi:hypothetical protein
VIEEFWLPFDGVGVSDGDQIFLVGIRHTLIVTAMATTEIL